jgi:NAD(P)-dependent dehydrogenase (short-subunit alcohol dehydrogenase family)
MHRQHHPEVVVITGASAGVGRATARAFARQRANIGLIARGKVALEAAKREIEELGGRALVLPLDVADWEAMNRAAAVVEKEFGPIDVWINNAMASVFSPFLEMTPDEFRRVTEVTYLGYVYGTMASLRRMKPRDRGVIVQVGSALAYRGIPLQSAYCGAKHAVEGFTESVRCELMHDHSRVRLTMVQLPALNTPQFSWVKSRLPRKPQPVPPIYQPEVAARAIVWAAKHPRRELNVGMSTSVVVAGNKFAAGLGDRYLARTGYESQMTEEPANPNRLDNLWQPLPGDRGAHGEFGAGASKRSIQLWATTHRGLLATAAIGAVAAIGCLWKNSKHRR